MMNYSCCQRLVLGLFLIGESLLFTLSAPVRTQAACITDAEQRQGWLNDSEVKILVNIPDPGCPQSLEPQNNLPNANIYLIAPINANHPDRPGGVYPLPPEQGGGSITIPEHDQVVERPIPSESVHANCFGSYVLAGPNATSDIVQTREDPNGSGLKLAYAIKFGGRFQPLTANWIIRAGVAQGLLSLDPSIGFGGTCWTNGPVSSTP